MPRSNWHVVAALAGLGLLFWVAAISWMAGASHNPTDERYQTYRQATEQPSQVSAPLSAQATAQALQYRTPCRDPEGQGESDLCAQWKAANAAEDSAFWAKWGFWIAVIGSSFLLWQIMLTREAVQDTGKATKAMERQNEIAQTAGRPWLVATIDFERIEVFHGTVTWDAVVQVTNIGSSPAIAVSVGALGNIHGAHSEIGLLDIIDFCAQATQSQGAFSDNLLPNSPPISTHFSIDDEAARFGNEYSFDVVFGVTYKAAYSNEVHSTAYSVMATALMPEGANPDQFVATQFRATIVGSNVK